MVTTFGGKFVLIQVCVNAFHYISVKLFFLPDLKYSYNCFKHAMLYLSKLMIILVKTLSITLSILV